MKWLWQRICFGRRRSCLYRSNNFIFYSYLKSCVWLLLVAVTLPITSASCERSFSKMKLLKKFSRNSTTGERLGSVDLLSVERVRAKKIDLDDFVDEFDSRHDNRRIKLHWVDIDIKFWRSLCMDLCENYVAHCLFVWIFFGSGIVRASHMTRQS